MSEGNVLVLAEHSEGVLRKVTLSAVAFARQVAELTGGEVIGLVMGSGVEDVAHELARAGVDRVALVDDETFADCLAESYAPAVSVMASEHSAYIVCGAASMQGKDVLPRISAQLGAGMVSDVTKVWADDGELRYQRPMWAGNIMATVACDGDPVVVSVRTTAFDPAAVGDEEAPMMAWELSVPSEVSTHISFDRVKSERPDLNDAAVIISGGRGLKSAENFAMLEELADLFEGAVGASRAAVDSGMAPNDWQIGQTGKIVAPDLYFAVAISGAIQHLAGMKGSKTIVAINKDPEAPIFQVADYGLVADAFNAVPELNEKIRGLRSDG